MSVDVGMATGYLDLDINGFLNGLKTAQSEAANATTAMGEKIGKGFITVGEKLESVGKTLSTAITAPIVAGVAAAVKSYASLEQAVGGVETLFKGSASSVIANAETAYKRAGVSSVEYMEQVTSFSARLLQATKGDTEKAAKYADMAMVDMADNANKFGTNIGSIQDAYQGFAKANYTMLDNLKLGYGGTADEMKRLLEDASALTGKEYNLDNIADIYEAIHVIQTELGITGTTALEAEETLSGSFGMMKAAVSDFLAHLGDPGADMAKFTANMLEAFRAVIRNIKRVLFTIWDNIPLAGWQKNMIAAAAAAGPLLIVVGKLSTGIGNTITAFSKISGVMSKMPGITGMVSKAFSVLLSPVGLVIAAIAVLAGAFVYLYNNNKQFGNAIRTTWAKIQKIFKESTDKIKKNFEQLVKAFKPVVDSLKKVWDAFCTVLAPIFIGAFNMIANAMKTIFDSLAIIINIFTSILQGNWAEAWTNVKLLAQTIWDGLIAQWQTFTTMFMGVFDALLALISTTWEVVWNGVVAFVTGIWNGIVALFAGAWEGIKSIFSAPGEFFSGVWEGIKGAFSAVVGWFGTLFANAWQSIKDNFPSLVNWASTIWTGIKGGFSAVAEWFGGIFKSAWQAIKDNFPSLANWAATTWAGIQRGFNAVMEWFGGIFKSAWQAVKDNFPSLANWASTLWAEIKQAFNAAATWFGEIFTKGWNGIVKAFEEWNPLGWAQEIWTNVTSGFPSGEEIFGWFKGLFGKAWEGIQSAFEGFGEWATGIWETIQGWFGGGGSGDGSAPKDSEEGKAFGQSIMSGIEAGIAEKEESLKGKVQQIGKDIISLLDQEFGTGEASKTKGHGRVIIDGIAAGITEFIGNVTTTLSTELGKVLTGGQVAAETGGKDIGIKIAGGIPIGVASKSADLEGLGKAIPTAILRGVGDTGGNEIGAKIAGNIAFGVGSKSEDLQGLGKAIPTVIGMGVESAPEGLTGKAAGLASAFAVALGGQAFVFSDAGVKVSTKVGDGTVKGVGQITNRVPGMVTTIINAWVRLHNRFVDEGKLLSSNTGDGMSLNVVAITNRVPSMVSTIINAWVRLHNRFSGEGKLLSSNIGDGMSLNVVAITNRVPSMVSTIINAWVAQHSRFVSEGKELANKLANGFGGNTSIISSKIPSLMNPAVSAVKGFVSQFKSAGADCAEGIWAGFESKKAWLEGKIRAMMRDLVKIIKSELKIESPSKVFRDEIGQWLPMGIAEGFEDAMPKAIKSIEDTFGEMTLADWFESTEKRILASIGNMLEGIQALASQGRFVIGSDGSLGYVSYGGFKPSGGRSRASSEEQQTGKQSVGRGGDTFNFYSPKALDEIEAARQMKRAKRDLAEGF